MELGKVEKIVISKGKKTTEVVYKEAAYRIKGKVKFISRTRHERNS